MESCLRGFVFLRPTRCCKSRAKATLRINILSQGIFMTTEAWIILFSTPNWVFRVMVVTAIVAAVCILYAITSDVGRIWSQRPRQPGNTREIAQDLVPGLRRDLKC